ncbi:MAG: hypothetical protein ABEH40_06185 [Haloferacaceae archaeon]
MSDGGADDDRDRGESEADDGEEASEPPAGRSEPLEGLTDRIRRARSRRAAEAEAENEDAEGAGNPFAELERTMGEGAGEPGAAAEGGEPDDEDPFERVEVDDIDEEEVWESLDAEEGPEADQPSIGAGADAERVEREDPGAERPDHVVEKGAYCQRCRFLSEPPEVRCTHEGTDIVEVVDSDRFRVRGCPMVAQGGAVDRASDHDDGN